MYKHIVPFLGAALGKDCEVVLHDLRHPEESVIAIANGDQPQARCTGDGFYSETHAGRQKKGSGVYD